MGVNIRRPERAQMLCVPISMPSSLNILSTSFHIPSIGLRYWSLWVAAMRRNGVSFNYRTAVLNSRWFRDGQERTASPMRGIISFQVLSAAALIPWFEMITMAYLSNLIPLAVDYLKWSKFTLLQLMSLVCPAQTTATIPKQVSHRRLCFWGLNLWPYHLNLRQQLYEKLSDVDLSHEDKNGLVQGEKAIGMM